MNRNIHPIQFQLFMGAEELKNTITDSGDRGRLGEFPSHYGFSPRSSTSSWNSWDESFEEEETMDDLWNRKLAESKSSDYNVHGSGVHESIKKEGFRPGKPIKLHWDESEDGEEPDVKLSDAHHRVAAAADIERTTGKNIWIPVDNHDPGLPYRLRNQR